MFRYISTFISILVVVQAFYLPKKSADSFLRDEYSIDPMKEPSAWSEVVVIQMHYDCEGLLVRQEMSKLKIRSGVARIPGEAPYKDMYKNVYKMNEVPEELQPETPVSFQSMKQRLRTTTPRPIPSAPKNPFFDPDRIIETPIRPCPEGQNDDPTGKCREIFPEKKR